MVDSLVSKIQETGQHAAKKTDVVITRARDAGGAFLDEVLGAGRDVVVFVRAEAKGWKRFLTLRTTQLQTDARSLFTVPAIERELLTRVDGTLKTIDSKVRARLQELEQEAAKPRRRATTNGKPPAPARKGKGAAPAKGAGTATVSLRH